MALMVRNDQQFYDFNYYLSQLELFLCCYDMSFMKEVAFSSADAYAFYDNLHCLFYSVPLLYHTFLVCVY